MKVSNLGAIFLVLGWIQASAASSLTQCGDYKIDRVAQEIFSEGAEGKKTQLGFFSRAPVIQTFEMYPGFSVESFHLTSGDGFEIRASQGQRSGILLTPSSFQYVGSCFDPGSASATP